jgi:hypothetical protein
VSYGLGIPTFEANKIGVRRVYTLGFLASAPDPDTISGLKAAGYDPGILSTLVALGATDEQLLALPYPASSDEMAAGVSNLMNILSGAQAAPGQGAQTAASYPTGAIPQIQTDLMGTIDLSLRSTWDAVTSQFTTIGNQLNALAAKYPNDPNIIQWRSQYNSLASQFGGAWQSVFSSTSPVKTLGTWEDVATVSGIVILGGVAIMSGVAIPLVAVVGSVLAGLYVIAKGINAYNASTAVGQTIANTANLATGNQSALITAYNKAVASGDTATANNILKALNAVAPAAPAPASTSQLTSWFTQNWVGIAAVIVGIAVLPPLIKKL